jgi:hypothetical protein
LLRVFVLLVELTLPLPPRPPRSFASNSITGPTTDLTVVPTIVPTALPTVIKARIEVNVPRPVRTITRLHRAKASFVVLMMAMAVVRVRRLITTTIALNPA